MFFAIKIVEMCLSPSAKTCIILLNGGTLSSTAAAMSSSSLFATTDLFSVLKFEEMENNNVRMAYHRGSS